MPRLTAMPAVLGQRDVRPDAGGEDHGVGLDAAAVRKLDGFDVALAVDARGLRH